MSKYYTGIGSRKTPQDILKLMEFIAIELGHLGYILRSGGADGADTAFEAGCHLVPGKKEIFLPWPGFNGREGDGYIYPPSKRAFEIASHFHPAWHKCSYAAKCLHARNSHQILGRDLNTPTEFVVCWHQNSGGTMQAVRIASNSHIPIYNLAGPGMRTALTARLESLRAE